MKTRFKNEHYTPTIFHFIKPFIEFLVLIIIGVVGYMKIQGWHLLDALFMSVETLTTVGYGFDFLHLSVQCKLFTIIYVIFGVTLFLYFAAEFAQHIFMANFEGKIQKKKMENKLKNMKNHFIICGYGRTGMEIASQLRNNKIEFVVVDSNLELEEELLKNEFPYVIGNATEDDVLEVAGIERATGIFCSLSDDVDNLYLAVSAKNIKNDIKIIARCVKAANEQKFKKAGTTTVILPYEISARRMVASVVKPLVVDFLDVVTHTRGLELELKLDQFHLGSDSELVGQTIISSKIRDKTGVVIVALKRENEFITNPSPDTKLLESDYLLAIGSNQQLKALRKLL
jgi:voltage-gated potassium channel